MTRSLRIAVADDEQDMRDFFEKMLPRLGHKVVSVAETGSELVKHCQERNPDLVITDIMMPDMDGIEAAVEISRNCPTPIILVSAFHDSELIVRAEADYVLGYLVKPIGQANLGPAIGVAMRRFDEIMRLHQETINLQQALADRKIIEQAKGVLMRAVGIQEKDAFRRLQELAAERNKKLAEAAQEVLALEKAFRAADS